jgi:hypothetical protein
MGGWPARITATHLHDNPRVESEIWIPLAPIVFGCCVDVIAELYS